MTVRSKAHGCSWKLENFPETSYLLVYGASRAAKVKVDGKVLPQVTAVAFKAMPAGWQADLAGNRLVIRLPSDQAPQNRLTRAIELEY